MDEKITKEVERFNATSEDGQMFTVIIAQEFTVTHPYEGDSKEIPGYKFAVTSDGRDLNFMAENKFEIVESGTIITKV